MRKYALTLATLLLLVASISAQRIDPAGIAGAVLVPAGDVTEVTAQRFIELAGGKDARIVLVYHSSRKAKKGRIWPEVKLIHDAAKEKGGPEPVAANLITASKTLRDATGVWLLIESEDDWAKDVGQTSLGEDFRALLERGGVIAASPGTNMESVSVSMTIDLLPGLVHYLRRDVLRKTKPELIGYDIDRGSAMLLTARTLATVGPGKTVFHVPGKFGKREVVAAGKIMQDLTALRRLAHDRMNAFPPAKPEPPFVPKGTLVIVGGGGAPDGLHKKFVEFAGGPGKAKIVILPTAQPDPLPRTSPKTVAFWKKAGAEKVTLLPGRTLKEVESKEYLDAFKEATGIWFDGGRQWRFVDAYENTKALPLMFGVLARGGVIGGSSAGATIQGDYLARGGVFHNFDIRYEGYERGLGFLKGVAIDQHFSQRKRQADMTSLMKIYPQYLGIGIDEATAIVVKGSVADVIGKGKVHFYDASRKVENGRPDYEALSAGSRYDLKARKALP